MQLPEIPDSLRRISSTIHEFAAPSVAFELQRDQDIAIGKSHLGGEPHLPRDFRWPSGKSGPLDFLLQINLAQASPFDATKSLPPAGILSFFYDLKEQPSGYDPANLEGFRVTYTPPGVELMGFAIQRPECALESSRIEFREGITLPALGSRAYKALKARTRMSDSESSVYAEFFSTVERHGRGNGNHHLLGHSENIQNDMQLEAQLVTNGLYCGNATGYNDPRRKSLEPGADDWLLLLQLDSDDDADFMWGDSGMLYYWIRKQDLAKATFDNVWMTMQCC